MSTTKVYHLDLSQNGTGIPKLDHADIFRLIFVLVFVLQLTERLLNYER